MRFGLSAVGSPPGLRNASPEAGRIVAPEQSRRIGGAINRVRTVLNRLTTRPQATASVPPEKIPLKISQEAQHIVEAIEAARTVLAMSEIGTLPRLMTTDHVADLTAEWDALLWQYPEHATALSHRFNNRVQALCGDNLETFQ